MGIVASAKVDIFFPQDQRLYPEDYFNIYRNGGAGGEIDYDHAINAASIPAWPDAEGKVGDGYGPDGAGCDGYGSGGYGDGMGADGMGPDGIGVGRLEFTTRPLTDGTYTFAIMAIDAAGNPSAASGGCECQATVAGSPKAVAAAPTPSEFDGDNDEITMTIALSPNDDG